MYREPMGIIDLTASIGSGTFSPPSVNKPIDVTVTHKSPGYWQVTQVTMALHAGSHVDFTKHFDAEGETAEGVDLERTCGRAVILDLGELATGHLITPEDLSRCGITVEPGEIILVRTGWTDRAWGAFPRYYVDSPSCSPEAAQWLVETGASAIGFDCFPEGAAKKTSYSPEDFVVHRIIGLGGAVLMQSLTNLSALPNHGARFSFFGAFLKFEGAEGAPARFFALLPD